MGDFIGFRFTAFKASFCWMVFGGIGSENMEHSPMNMVIYIYKILMGRNSGTET
jgi:hypothetical protein